MNVVNFVKRRDERSWAAFIPTKSGTLSLSIVAGNGLYSTPRTMVSDSKEFTQFELAIFNAGTNEWGSYNEVKPVFDIIGKGEYQETNWDDEPLDLDKPQCAVFGWVDTDDLNKIWEIL